MFMSISMPQLWFLKLNIVANLFPHRHKHTNRVGAYYLARMLTNWVTELLSPIIFAVIVWGLTNQRRTAEAFGIYIAVTVLNALCFGGLGYCLAALTSNEQVAMAMGKSKMTSEAGVDSLHWQTMPTAPLARPLGLTTITYVSHSIQCNHSTHPCPS